MQFRIYEMGSQEAGGGNRRVPDGFAAPKGEEFGVDDVDGNSFAAVGRAWRFLAAQVEDGPRLGLGPGAMFEKRNPHSGESQEEHHCACRRSFYHSAVDHER
ncbi:hypothetical protein [Citrifermentans bemidjiense]|uniref:hypothetical protein n=1 Tax=Citrifermentans bemidjiense TaxID=225194 RepID=UPI00145CBD65|nr:hypothetical protein [Citrifermentans bemidjiense]